MGFENGMVLRVSVVAKNNATGNTQVNVWHYDSNNKGDLVHNDPQALADRFRDDVMPKAATLVTSGWTIQPVVVAQERDPQNPNAARQEWTSGAALPGTLIASGDYLPPSICTVATLVTEHIGRRYRGRKFLLGMPNEEHWIPGGWDTTWLQFQQAYLDAVPRQPDIASGVSSAVCDLSVYSRTQRAQDVDPYMSRVTDIVLHNRMHWLSSRYA